MAKFPCSVPVAWVPADWLPLLFTTTTSPAKSRRRPCGNASQIGNRMSPEELEQIADAERERQAKFKHTVKVCVAAGCVSCQSEAVKTALETEVSHRPDGSDCQV